MMENARRRIVQGQYLHLTGLIKSLQVLEQKGVVARLDADDVVRTGLAQVAEMRCVGAEGVFDDDHRQMGMLLAKPFQPTAGGVPLAVVLGLTVLLDDRLRYQGMTSLRSGWTRVAPSS